MQGPWSISFWSCAAMQNEVCRHTIRETFVCTLYPFFSPFAFRQCLDPRARAIRENLVTGFLLGLQAVIYVMPRWWYVGASMVRMLHRQPKLSWANGTNGFQTARRSRHRHQEPIYSTLGWPIRFFLAIKTLKTSLRASAGLILIHRVKWTRQCLLLREIRHRVLVKDILPCNSVLGGLISRIDRTVYTITVSPAGIGHHFTLTKPIKLVQPEHLITWKW